MTKRISNARQEKGEEQNHARRQVDVLTPIPTKWHDLLTELTAKPKKKNNRAFQFVFGNDIMPFAEVGKELVSTLDSGVRFDPHS